MPTPDPGLKLIAARLRASPNRSPLYRWLKARHDKIAQLFEQQPPDWRCLAGAFAELGMAAPSGAPLAPASVRHTWWRVRRDVAQQRGAKRKPPLPVTLLAPASAIAEASPPPSSDPLAALRQQLNQRSGRP